MATDDNAPTQDFDLEQSMDMSDAREPVQAGLVKTGVGRALVDHRPPSVTERLMNEKHEIELRLQAINEVLAQLEANPATREIIDSLSKLGHGQY